MIYTNKLKYNQIIKLFFDFYVINELWFRTIGQKEFGYVETKIIPYNKEKKIEEIFRNRVNEMKDRVIFCLEKSVRGEIKHFNYFGPDGASYRHKFSPEKHILKAKRMIVKYGNRKAQWPLEAIHEAFLIKYWDEVYGGKPWAKATEYL